MKKKTAKTKMPINKPEDFGEGIPQKTNSPKYDLSNPEVKASFLSRIQTLAAQGLTKAQIAAGMDLHHETLSIYTRSHPEISEAIQLGRQKGVATITNKLFTKAKEGDMSAIKYYLNNVDKDNWKDRHEQTLSGSIGVMTHEEALAKLRGKDSV